MPHKTKLSGHQRRFLRLIWPLVQVQQTTLKAWMRKQCAPCLHDCHTVGRWGKVSLRHMLLAFAERGYAARSALKPFACDFALTTAPAAAGAASNLSA